MLALPHGLSAQQELSLTQVHLMAKGSNQSIFDLTSTARPTGYTLLGGDPMRPGSLIPQTGRGQSAVSPQGLRAWAALRQ